MKRAGSILLIVILSVVFVYAEDHTCFEQLSSPLEDNRADACLSLGKIGGDRAIDALEKRLKDKSILVRHSAALGLAMIGGEHVESIFAEMLRSSSVEKRRIAAVGLGTIGADNAAVDLLIEQLGSSQWQVRWSVCHALGEIGDTRVLPSLRSIAENDIYQKKNGEYPVRDEAKTAIQTIQTGIRWYGTMKGAFSAARDSSKPIMLVFYLKDSSWSDALFTKIFRNEQVISTCEQFICVRLQVDKESVYRKRYGIKGAPTILFIDARGQYIDKLDGFVPAKRLCEKMDAVVSSAYSLSELEARAVQRSNDTALLLLIAERYMEKEEIDQVLEYTDRIIELDPRNKRGNTERALFMAGFLYGKINKFHKSVSCFERLLALSPEYVDGNRAKYCMALGYIALGESLKARKTLEDIIKNTPKNSFLSDTARKLLKKIS